MGSPTAADAASILDGVRRTRRDVRARYLRTFFGRGWIFSLALGVATFGSIAVTSLFGTRTTDGGQAVFAVYWTVMGLATLVAVWVLHRREPIRGPTETHVGLAGAVFALGFAAVFFSPLAHNHLYLSPILFALTYLIVAAVQARWVLAGAALLVAGGLGVLGIDPAIANGRTWPEAAYGAGFLVMGAIARLSGPRTA